jgi:hypothetical protein
MDSGERQQKTAYVAALDDSVFIGCAVYRGKPATEYASALQASATRSAFAPAAAATATAVPA